MQFFTLNAPSTWRFGGKGVVESNGRLTEAEAISCTLDRRNDSCFLVMIELLLH